MTWIKICGITNLDDGLEAVEAGADAVGFVFYKKSPRYVDAEAVRGIVAKLPNNVEKIGVFVDETWENIQATAARAGLTGIQIHADGLRNEDTKRGARPFTVKRYLALRVLDFLDGRRRLDSLAVSVKTTTEPDISAVFLDSGTTQQPGGTGRAFDWERARHVADGVTSLGFPLVVAGGLTPDNVTEAIRILEPWGVDVSSGVEARPGKKDPEKIRAFVAAVRNIEKAV
jgi:phosphoribosylanthranilate isomerase